MKVFITLLLFAAALPLTAMAGAQLEKLDLFMAGAGGYAQYRIPGIIVTKGGTVLAYCEARRTGKSDWDAIDIVLRRSTDGGKTWTDPQRIADVPGPKAKNPAIKEYKLASPEEVTYNNPVAIADRDGSVHFLVCLEYMRCFHLRSEDDGLTWTAPVEITAAFEKFRPEWDWKVLATGPGHGIQLKSGRLLVPVWLSTGTGGGNAHRPSVTATIFSDDAGRTWHHGDLAVTSTAEWINPNETSAVELADGRVMLNVRTESKAHRRLVTTSPDGATKWSRPHFDNALLEPICMASMVQLSEHPLQNPIIFANPHNLSRADQKEVPGKSRDRKNLAVKLTYNEGVSWPLHRVLESGPSGYSDLAVTPDGRILCFYERGSTNATGNNYAQRLTVARFDLEWLMDDPTTPK